MATAHSSTPTRLASDRKRPARSAALSHFGAGLGDVAQALGGLLVLHPATAPNCSMALALAREQRRVAHATAGLDQLRGRQVHFVHQQRGREIDEARALVRPRDQRARTRAARCRADRDHVAHACASSAPSRRESGQTSPARGMPAAGIGRAERLRRHAVTSAAQRIARRRRHARWRAAWGRPSGSPTA